MATATTPAALKTVLSIDGGGIRGVIPARVLQEIEKRMERPIAELFDLVAGHQHRGHPGARADVAEGGHEDACLGCRGAPAAVRRARRADLRELDLPQGRHGRRALRGALRRRPDREVAAPLLRRHDALDGADRGRGAGLRPHGSGAVLLQAQLRPRPGTQLGHRDLEGGARDQRRTDLLRPDEPAGVRAGGRARARRRRHLREQPDRVRVRRGAQPVRPRSRHRDPLARDRRRAAAHGELPRGPGLGRRALGAADHRHRVRRRRQDGRLPDAPTLPLGEPGRAAVPPHPARPAAHEGDDGRCLRRSTSRR